MFDMLYVHPLHSLAPQITIYYRLCAMEKLPWTIDPTARLVIWSVVVNFTFYLLQFPYFILFSFFPMSGCFSGGMNGFMWLTQRNSWKQVIPSPVNGLDDITNNVVL